MRPPASRDGPGLAPLSRVVGGVPLLPPQEDALVIGPMRRAIAEERRRGNEPGARALERVLPLVAEGAAALLRMRRDGLADIETQPGDL